MDYSGMLWLYERLKMYLDVNCINLEFHKFYFKGKEYTQQQMINMMIERLEFSFREEYDDMDQEQYTYVHEVWEIWSIVSGAMWW